MTLASTSANDAPGGTGTREVDLRYLDGNGDQQSEIVTLNGTSPVDTTATDISFINEMYSETVGSNGLAAGDITIYKKGAVSTVYNIIKANNNYSLTGIRKVPANKTYYVNHFHGSQTNNQPTSLRLRSTDAHGELHAGVFNFKSVLNLENSALEVAICEKIPALSIIKVTAWAKVSGGNASSGFCGILVDN